MKIPYLDTFEVIRRYLEDNAELVDSQLIARALGMCRARNASGLAAIGDLKGTNVDCIHEARFRLQVAAFVKKNEALENHDCVDTAHNAWLNAELRCRITNRRLTHYYLHPGRVDSDVELYVSKMVRIIASVLGNERKFLNLIPRLLSVTDGATATSSRRMSLPNMKLRRKVEAPARAIPYLEALRDFMGYGECIKFLPHESDTIEYVPKSYKTRRTIAKPPTGGLPLQLAVDAWLKGRLKRRGIDLESQDGNQELARIGSIDGSFATIDIEGASDSIALDLIHLLFPEGWSRILCDFRSSLGWVPSQNTTLRYAKFASMGNGSTFVVETLVFFAASRAVGSKRCLVYGDDIAVEVEYVPALTKLLKYLGFKVNNQKSFSAGPFRESCGANWFRGTDITPFYIRRNATTRVEACHQLNGLASIGMPGGSLWDYAKDVIHRHNLPYVPWTLNTRAGISLTPNAAYRQGSIRSKAPDGSPWIPSFKSYVPISGRLASFLRVAREAGMGGRCAREWAKAQVETFRCFDSRALFLWYLSAVKRTALSRVEAKLWDQPCDTLYVRTWVGYNPPRTATPEHLGAWSDFVAPPK